MNTIILPRASWNLIISAVEEFIYEAGIQGGYTDEVLKEINNQLDNQEY